MMHKLVPYLVTSTFTLVFLTSCTSKKSDDAASAEVAAVESELAGDTLGTEFQEDEQIIADLGSEELSPEEKGSDPLLDDPGAAATDPGVASDAGGEQALDSATESFNDPMAAADPAAGDQAFLENPPDNLEPEATPSATSGSIEDLAGSPTSGSDGADPLAVPDSEFTPPPVNFPLQKIKDVPFEKSGILANAVYVGRKGDTLKAVSQKIYGADKSKDLRKLNSFLKRGVRVGDKIYYNSPMRPTDATRMLTFYEDMGIAPAVYIARGGESIRTISKNLLGHKDSWKEIWSTNMAVESKDVIPEGTELRYWTNEAVAAAMTPATAAAPSDMAMAEMPPAMPPSQAMNLPPQPDMQAVPPPPAVEMPPPAMAQQDLPPPEAFTPPPPRPSPPSTATFEEPSSGLLGGQDQTMMIGAAGVIILAGIGLVVVRRKRAQKAMEFTHTQIE